MLIHVADLTAPDSVDSIEVPALAAGPSSVLYVPVPKWTSVSYLDDLIHRIPQAYKSSADAVVLRLHPPEAEELASHAASADDIAYRVSGVPLYALEWLEDAHRLTNLSPEMKAQDPGWTDEDIISRLRQAELTHRTHKSGVVLPQIKECHYEGPNGGHYTSFLRPGLALQSTDALDALVFWLLPQLTPEVIVITDSWTILAVGLNCNRYLADCRVGSLRVRGVECLQSYDDPAEAVVRRLRAIQGHTEATSQVVFLMSVSSTGRLRDRLVEAFSSAHIETRIVTFFAPSTYCPRTGETVLCSLPGTFSKYDRSSCPLCPDNPYVRIEPTTYLMEISAAAKTASIRRQDAFPAKEFFDRYAGTGCVTVHTDQHDRTRHHMIHIDVQTLSGHPLFQGRLDRLTEARRGLVDLILTPSHKAATVLSRRVSSSIGVPVVSVDETAIANLSSSDRELLVRASRILIVDDVVITGTRLRGYKGHLQRAGFVKAGTEVDLLVGVARPDRQTRLQGVIDMLHGKEHFHAVETLILPDWRETQCPWCRELSLMQERSFALKGGTVMESRFYDLSKRHQGLKNGLFLPSSARSEGALVLGPGAIFGPEWMTQAELYASVASAMQQLRNLDELNEVYKTPIAKVLKPDFYVEGRYYNSVILASILRAARSHDLRSTIVDVDLEKDFSSRFFGNDATDLRAEILLAVHHQKLPRFKIPQDISMFVAEAGVSAFLKSLLQSD